MTNERQAHYYKLAKRDGKLDKLPLEYWPAKLDRLENDVYSAFCRMSQQRNERRPISDSAIEEYARLRGTCGIHFDDFMALIVRIDMDYLEAIAEKWERDKPKK